MSEDPIELRPFTRELVKDNIASLIEMSRQIRNDYWILEHYLSDLNRKWELSYAAFCSGSVCGFIIVSDKEQSHHIHRIAVQYDLRNKGIGKTLTEQAVADAKEQEKSMITLKVDVTNTEAISFYKQLNFEITGAQGELLLMSLKIKE